MGLLVALDSAHYFYRPKDFENPLRGGEKHYGEDSSASQSGVPGV